MKRSYIRQILDAIDEETISFAGGLPNEAQFPLEAIQKATMQALKKPSSLQYSKSQGLDSLREKIATLYSQNFDFPTSKEQVLITTGSQQAFDIILKVFGKDEVVVQNLSYIGALGAFSNLGLGVSEFDEIDELKRVLHCSNDLYLMSDFINPTSKSYDKKEREQIATILEKKGNFLIEDGAYSLLSFDGKIEQPICAKVKKSFHLCSFSKIIAPGLRVGWIRASEELISKILASKESTDLHTPTLNQMIIDNFLEENSLQNHLKLVRADYEQRMSFMSSCMKKYMPSFRFEEPKGGMFIYGYFEDKDSMLLAKKAMKEKVAFVPAQAFKPKNQRSSAARFNFTNSSLMQIEIGIKRLSIIVEKQRFIPHSIWGTLFKSVVTPQTL